jgi:hypothetical protein
MINYCRECGTRCKVLENGVSHHIDEDDNTDHEADADHVAIPEFEQ